MLVHGSEKLAGSPIATLAKSQGGRGMELFRRGLDSPGQRRVGLL
jgi:hypothetical protein